MAATVPVKRGEILKGAFAAVTEQPFGQAQQPRLRGHDIFQGALNRSADLLAESVLHAGGSRRQVRGWRGA